MRLQICVSVVICLLFSAYTSLTPAPTDRLERPTPAVLLSATASNSTLAAPPTQETTQSKKTPDCPSPSETVHIAPQYYGPAAGNSPVWAIINKPTLVFSMSKIKESP